MKIIAGLGNPGAEYAKTKHNVGFMFIDALADALGLSASDWKDKFEAKVADARIGTEKVVLVKPQTYMNESGRAVGPLMNWYKLDPEDLIVVHDDMDIPAGTIRIRKKGSAGGHNGIKSIDRSLGTPKYARVRMGVGHSKRGANAHDNTVNWVLGGFGPDQRKQLPEFLADGADAAEDIIFHGLAKTQEKFNGR